MKVITCINDEKHPGYEYVLKASCNYFRFKLITVFIEDIDWETHRKKDTGLRKALADLDDNEIVLFTDGFDTMLISSPDDILLSYEKARNGKNLLISAEKSCFPDTRLADSFDTKLSPFAYVNSGGIMGTVGAFKHALESIELIRMRVVHEVDAFPFSNQYLWTLFALENPDEIELDRFCKVFQTLTPDMSSVRHLIGMEEDMDLRKKHVVMEFENVMKDFQLNGPFELWNVATASKPKHLHFNSPLSKYNMFQEPYLGWIELLNVS